MSRDELVKYNYKLGAAIHLIPETLQTNGTLTATAWFDINQLDPSGTKNAWGDWAKEFADTILVSLPMSPLDIFNKP